MTRILQHPDVNDEQKSRRIQSNGLAVDCFLNSNGKLCRKIEHVDGVASEFVYGFDARGHLLSVLRNGRLEEQYRYNQAGQRV